MQACLKASAIGCVAAVLGLWSFAARAQVVLDDCTEEALRGALEAGVVVIEDCSVTIRSPLLIESVVQIIGAGTNDSIIEAEGSRIFEVLPNSLLEVSDMTFSGGSNRLGGAIYIHEGGEAIFNNCVFSDNAAPGRSGGNGGRGVDYFGIGGDGQAGQDGTAGFGGAVYNLGNVTFSGCHFVRNSAVGGTGGDGGAGGNGGYAGGAGGSGGNGALGRGGAIFNGVTGTLVIWDTTLERNTAEGGSGGFGGAGGEGPQNGTAGRGGQGASASGAAIYSEGFSEIVNCTFWTNTASAGDSADDGSLNGGNIGGDACNGGRANGGALYNAGESGATNCTFSENRAVGGAGGNGGDGRYEAGDGGDGGNAYGGGIFNSGLQWLMNCTLSQNGVTGGTNGVAGTGPAAGSNGRRGAAVGASVFGTAAGEFYYKNSIFGYPSGSTNGAGGLIGMGNNISSDKSMPLGPDSLSKTNPLLYTLADNGGPTATMLLQPNSAAVNAGDMDGALDFDQRGFPRPSPEDGLPDIGAVELVGPTITEDPLDQDVDEGERVTFSVSVEGDPPFSYYWMLNGTNIPGARSSSYTILSARLSNEGDYSVLVSNVAGVVESLSATLTVNAATAPTITLEPESMAALPGSTVSFTVGATGSMPMFVQWRSNNVAIARGTNWTLTLTNVKTSFTANYSALVTNIAGSATSDTARLTVAEGAPVITNQPLARTVSAGADVTFSVGATGAPPLSVQWRSNSVAIAGQTNWSLVLQNVQTNYSADYSARVTNAIGPVISSAARLRVETPPAVAAAPVGGTNFNLSFSTVTGLTYVTEFKNTLAATNWTPFRTNVGTGLLITNVDRMSNSPTRFYRIRTQ